VVCLEKRVFLVPEEQADKSFLLLDFAVSSSSVRSSSLERVFPNLVIVSRIRQWTHVPKWNSDHFRQPSETKLNPAATHTSKQNVVSCSPAWSVNLLWARSTQIAAKVKKNESGNPLMILSFCSRSKMKGASQFKGLKFRV
jgi:hypothetical protein